jgi:hypothetical protein
VPENDSTRSGFRTVPTAGKMGWGHVTLTLDLDVNALHGYTDEHLAAIWHATQATPASYGDRIAAEVVKKLTFEIVRRWLTKAPIELYRHQPDSHENMIRSAVARYRPGGADDRDGAFYDGAWTVKGDVIDAILAGPPPATQCPYCGNDGTTKPATAGAPSMLDDAPGLARVEYGPGAGKVWICRDSEACRTRVWRAADTDDSLICARCTRTPGVAAAPDELYEITTDDGPRWVCTDTGRCDRRIADGARPPYRFDKEQQKRVAEIRAAREAKNATDPKDPS